MDTSRGGRDVAVPQRRVAATTRLRRGHSIETGVRLRYGKGFAFQSYAWERSGLAPGRPGCRLLQTSIRQEGDRRFADLLAGLRRGDLTPDAEAAFEACHVRAKAAPTDGIVPTKLYVRRADSRRRRVAAPPRLRRA